MAGAVPVVILAAVDSSGSGEAGMDQGGVANATDQTILMPRSIRHPHDVTIRNNQSASFAHLIRINLIQFHSNSFIIN